MEKFDRIRGQEKALHLIKTLLRNQSSTLSLLFEGPAGVGKATSALLTAASHLCLRNPFNPCTNCKSCRKVSQGTHPGLFLIDPQTTETEIHPLADQLGIVPNQFEDSTGPDTIGIQPIRNLRNELNLKPSGNRRRAVVLGDFDRATVESQNALLKTLEEPPEGTLIICSVETLSGVVDTIVSRCQRIKFHPLSSSETADILIQQASCSREEASFLARISGGRPGRAMEFLSADVQNVLDWFQELLENYGVENDPRFRKLLLEKLKKQSGDQKKNTINTIFLLLETFFRDAMHQKTGEKEEYEPFFPEPVLQRYLENTTWERLIRASKRLEKLKRGREVYIHHNVLLENLLL